MSTVHVAASEDYRRARAELLAAEGELRAAAAAVAALRAALPPGPEVDSASPLTTAGGKPITLDDVFGDHRTLVGYHLAFDATADEPDETSARDVDALDAQVPWLRSRTAIAVFAPAPPHRLARLAEQRGWRWIVPISTQPGELSDRLGLSDEDRAEARLTVFVREGTTARLHWHGHSPLTTPLQHLLPQ
ncbi:DUF899 family protein [Allokutzneria sp. A3M-2-11 16]|uniref:DUF899 family protein n=1 Tax=Allokutzneria sp. A3M-2-11 16 TaxID=2962043 RepID=UPI0020B85579|nr:DUF899 family protein [Allokutzneria sp. A3M-2-11 16]MCP3801267.1 DUF899 family protein [Allokutzneria sp. A3M-2-11 16]